MSCSMRCAARNAACDVPCDMPQDVVLLKDVIVYFKLSLDVMAFHFTGDLDVWTPASAQAVSRKLFEVRLPCLDSSVPPSCNINMQYRTRSKRSAQPNRGARGNSM